ncbi:MAG: hypothetical protein ACI8X5_003194 [Planctomycetota bacterium]|jgi:hypothetical protein
MKSIQTSIVRKIAYATLLGSGALVSQAFAWSPASSQIAPTTISPGGARDCLAAIPLPPDDPSLDQDFGCYHFATYNWNDGSGAGTVTGRVYWPSICGDGTTDPPMGTKLPTILLMHGDGHHYTDYNYLLGHLARNGFIVASITSSGTNLDRSAQGLTFLNFMTNSWSRREWVDTDRMGLIGHSRGGEAALTLARRIREIGLPYDIDSIISLAPTDNVEGGGIHESLNGDDSRSYLAIYGTHDEDVTGYCLNGNLPQCGFIPISAARSGFSLYDRAGSEGETEPFPLSSEVVDKAMVYIKGATHNGWRSTCAGFPPPGVLSCMVHQEMAKGYMNAFFRWQLRGQDIYRYFFSGEMKLPIVNSNGVKVQKTFQKGNGRRVVDNFEQAGWGTNTLGGTVTKESTVTVLKDGSTWDYEITSPHDTDSLIVSWSPPGLAPWMRFGIPDGSTGGFQPRRYRDITDYDFLSLRAGQIYGSPLNTVGTNKDFYVLLRDPFGGQTPWILVSDYSKLPYPTVANVVKFGQFLTVTSSPMNTVRIPTCRFNGVDKENISSVWFRFSVPGHSQGEIMIDNIEFTD